MNWVLIVPGSLLLGVGVYAILRPPRRIDGWFGYRTTRSTRSREAWDDANELSAQLLALAGFLSANTGATCWLIGPGFWISITIVSVITLLLCVATVLIVEKRLARDYDEHGRPR